MISMPGNNNNAEELMELYLALNTDYTFSIVNIKSMIYMPVPLKI